MGTSGSLIIVKREDWVERFESLNPLDFGFNIGFVLDGDKGLVITNTPAQRWAKRRAEENEKK